MLPLTDDNPRQNPPILTVAIIIACVAVFLWQASLGERGGQLAVLTFGLIPARLLGEADLPSQLASLPPWMTVFTSMFMHGDILHIGSNMLFLWIFGDNVEDSMGHARFVVFYLACGVAAALTQVAADPSTTEPMIGASGAIAGVLGAYILLHPRATVRTLVFLGIFITIIRIPAAVVLGLWFVLQVFAGFGVGAEEGVAVWAHVGGFVAGLLLVGLFKRRDVPLFQPPRSKAFSREAVRGPWG